MISVRIQDEVVDYLRRLAPQPRHALRLAIKDLAHEKGDIKALTDELEGFYSPPMSARDAVIDEIKTAPESLVRETYDFILFLKQRRALARDRETADAHRQTRLSGPPASVVREPGANRFAGDSG